ncbi:hypothetical protein L2E82_32749 [Cichorium intybus]|uniref:Uncharacterized protein n=1 Tax=Cichorium intybus TaxID=13427 RepID=A0ACB9BHR5_CICIN|nr:hypothetical protein L2E82_32749 [Cichorium intybus]
MIPTKITWVFGNGSGRHPHGCPSVSKIVVLLQPADDGFVVTFHRLDNLLVWMIRSGCRALVTSRPVIGIDFSFTNVAYERLPLYGEEVIASNEEVVMKMDLFGIQYLTHLVYGTRPNKGGWVASSDN